MKCEEVRRRLGAWLDGELSAGDGQKLEAHVAGCAECAAERDELVALSAGLRASVPRASASPELRERILVAVRAEAEHPATRAEVLAGDFGARRRPRFTPMELAWRWGTVGVAAVLVATLAWLPTRRARAVDQMASEVTSSHIRSLMASHLTDVLTSDRHTVKPWFNGRLDFSPPVPDLASEGFPLVGGRLDYLNGRAVAALVYMRRQHVINVFLWPAASGSKASTGALERNGYHLLRGRAGGMDCWFASDVALDDLKTFGAAFEQATGGP
jgi:anti-sigma factor (TIGR02949 family)